MKYIFLAFIQGMTEFLPVSSSGHLTFFQMLFGFEEPLLFFDIILHLATALAVIVFLRKEIREIIREIFLGSADLFKGKKLKQIWNQYANLKAAVFIFMGMIPIVLIGVFLHDLIDRLFSSAIIVGCSFIFTGLILVLTKFQMRRKNFKEINFVNAFLIGIAQAVAIIPGVSRSGMTIAAGIFQGIEREKCARFSFLLAIPTIIAAAGYKLKNGWGALNISFLNLSLSFIVAFISGYLALIILSKMIARAKFHYFGYYCLIMGIITSMLIFNHKL